MPDGKDQPSGKISTSRPAGDPLTAYYAPHLRRHVGGKSLLQTFYFVELGNSILQTYQPPVPLQRGKTALPSAHTRRSGKQQNTVPDTLGNLDANWTRYRLSGRVSLGGLACGVEMSKAYGLQHSNTASASRLCARHSGRSEAALAQGRACRMSRPRD